MTVLAATHHCSESLRFLGRMKETGWEVEHLGFELVLWDLGFTRMTSEAVCHNTDPAYFKHILYMELLLETVWNFIVR